MKHLKQYEGISSLMLLLMIGSLVLFFRGLFKDLKEKRNVNKLFGILGTAAQMIKTGEIVPTLNHFENKYSIDIILEDNFVLFIKFNDTETELYFNISYPSGNRTEIDVDLVNQTFVFNEQEYNFSDRTLRNVKKYLNSIKKHF